MLSDHSRQQDFAAGNYFSFSSPVSEHNEYGTWAENLKTLGNSFGKRDPHRKFGPWVRRIRLSDSAFADESDSSASSPPLWKSASPEPRGNISRAQMIAMCRQEMMDLVRGMPETAYELSLRDIVESPASQRMEKAAEVQEEEAALTERWEKRKGKGKKRVTKNGIMDSAWFLFKLFIPSIPAAVDGRKGESSVVRSKISPRPIAASAADGESSSFSSSSNGSKNGGCSGRGRQKWKFGECYPFLYRQRRSRSMEFQSY